MPQTIAIQDLKKTSDERHLTLCCNMTANIHKAENPITNGVRTFQSASMALTGGQESPPSVRAESPPKSVGADLCVHPGVHAGSLLHSGVCDTPLRCCRGELLSPPRAESPTGNSVGRNPTSRGTPSFKPCRSVGKWMSSFHSLKIFARQPFLNAIIFSLQIEECCSQKS